MVAICLSVVLLSIQPIYHGTELLAHGVSLERHRAVSLLAMQPNIYGGALAVFIPFPLVFLVRRLGGKRGRIFFGITVAVATYSLVLTLSRGSWLAMGVACIFLGFLFERRILLVLLLGIALAPLWVPQDAVNRADTMDLDEAADDDSAAVRVEQWKMIPAVLAAAPLGHGYQQFPAVYFELGGHFKGAHVGYADYAVEAGVPGLLLYVMLFVTIAVFAFGLARSGTTEFSRALGVALLGAIIAMAVAEAFGSRLKAGSVTAFLWMYAGTAVAAWRWPAEEGAGGSSPAVEPKRRGGITPRGRGRVAGAAAPTRRFAPAPEQE
jgi:O-antigen ligase